MLNFGVRKLLISNKTRIACIGFTTRCNIRCGYCWRHASKGPGCDLDLSHFDEIIATLHKRNVAEVLVSGIGETTMLKDWEKHCKKLLEEKFNLSIVTNLSRKYTDEEIETLSNFNTIALSCDTIDRELFKELRTGADLETVLDNFHRIKDVSKRKNNKLKAKIHCVVLDKNIHQLKDFVRFWISAGIDKICFLNFVHFCANNNRPEVKHPATLPHDLLKEGKEQLEGAIKIARDHGMFELCHQPLLDSINQRLCNPGSKIEHETQGMLTYTTVPKGLTRLCTAPWEFFMIHSDSNVFTCAMKLSTGSLGTLGKKPLDKILNGKIVREIRTRLLKGNLDDTCKACPDRAWGTKKDLKYIVSNYLKMSFTERKG